MGHFSLAKKRALVTGAASGIGLAVTRRFLDAGAEVIAADLHHSDELTATNCDFRALDVSSSDAVRRLFTQIVEEFGPIDILINNAGIALPEEPLVDADEAVFEKILRVNLYGVMYGLKYGPAMLRDGGCIINTASLAADVTVSGMTAYGVSKAAVVKLTRQAAMELGSRRIRVNAVCPGTTTTPMESSDSDESKLCAFTCIAGRPGSAEEQAAVFHFLASDEASYVNAQSINVDGGWIYGVTDSAVAKLLS